MNPEQVSKLEHECEQALAEVLRNNHSDIIPRRICRLMAKAAVTVLEAAQPDHQKKSVDQAWRATDNRKTNWNIDDRAVARVKAFIKRHGDNPFVRMRMATNLNESNLGPPSRRSDSGK